jgi:Holliday junction resolvase RusA-like endonuclease
MTALDFSRHVTFTVVGTPEPAGSKRAFPIKRGGQFTGRVAVTDANPRVKSWQGAVADAAAKAANGVYFEHEPVGLSLVFSMKRPAGHYGSGRNADKLKPSAPARPTVKPDALKLARAIEDALTGVVWRDDSQVVVEAIDKRYGVPEGVQVHLWPL